MPTTQSPFGLYNVMRFVASVEAVNGDSYGTALYASAKSDPALVENTQALIDVVSSLHKKAVEYAASRPVIWRTMSGEMLPNDLRQLLRAIINHGQMSFEHADFVVEWKDSDRTSGPTKILIELGDYFMILGVGSPTGPVSGRHKLRLALALAAVDAHFPSRRRKQK